MLSQRFLSTCLMLDAKVLNSSSLLTCLIPLQTATYLTFICSVQNLLYTLCHHVCFEVLVVVGIVLQSAGMCSCVIRQTSNRLHGVTSHNTVLLISFCESCQLKFVIPVPLHVSSVSSFGQLVRFDVLTAVTVKMAVFWGCSDM